MKISGPLCHLWRIAFMCLALVVAAYGQKRLDLNQPDDALKVAQKFQCSLTEGKPMVYWWKGSTYSRVPGERDRLLFNVEGMNIRACKILNDPQRGYGYRLVSREILLYLDPETGKVLNKWKNPWTNQDNEVIQVANDPVNQPPTYAKTAAGQPFKFNGMFKKGRVFSTAEVPLFYQNPLGGEYQEYVGGSYHAMEMFNFFAHEDELLDAAKTDADNLTVTWTRISSWLPWMEMGDRPGLLVFSCIGKRVASSENTSETMKAEIRQNYPIYTAPPPLDDTRPNETSWTYFKKVLDKKKQQTAPNK